MSARRSDATATMRPAACAFSMIGRRSRTSPPSSGYCSSRPNAWRHVHRVGITDVEADVERFRASLQDVQRLREDAARDQEYALLPGRRLLRLQPMEHRHRFGGRRALVEQRRAGDLHAGEVPHDRLEIEQRLEPALRDLGLVGRVGRIPAGILEDVPEDDARRDACRSSPSRCRTAPPCSLPQSSAAAAGSRTRCRLPASRAASAAGCRAGSSGRSAYPGSKRR